MTPVPVKQEDVGGQPDGEVRRLGEALGARVEDVVRRAAERGRDRGFDTLVPAVVESFERIGRNSTAAVAQWMAGGKPEAGLETGREAWHTYGQLAAQNAAPLNEVTKRCLRWRDAVIEVLHECADELNVSLTALGAAASMVQRTLDVTLVRMCEAFEQERARIADELTRRDEELVFMTTHDALTGLPNRTLILDRGEQMLVRARRLDTPVAALLIDLDNFTGINDTLGHATGDELLQAIAARLDGVVRNAATLGRIGGDEFVVLAEQFGETANAELIAERLREALKAPFILAGSDYAGITVTASIGVATGERGSVDDFCVTLTSRCTAPSGTARTGTWSSSRECRTWCRAAWSSRWTCAARSSTTSSSCSTSRRSTCAGWCPRAWRH